MKNIINIQNVIKTFKDFKAINDLSLEVKEGEIYGLLGSNGAGKSTTINILLGFLKPDSGEAFINDINTTLNYNEARKYIGYISENVNLYPYLTGIENLDYFCKLTGKEYDDKQWYHIDSHGNLSENAAQAWIKILESMFQRKCFSKSD